MSSDNYYDGFDYNSSQDYVDIEKTNKKKYLHIQSQEKLSNLNIH
jgi:hypothetical protein